MEQTTNKKKLKKFAFSWEQQHVINLARFFVFLFLKFTQTNIGHSMKYENSNLFVFFAILVCHREKF